MFDNGQQFNDWFNKPFESEDEDEGNNDQVPTDSFVSDSTDASIIVNINTSVDRISDISTVKRRKRSKKYRSNIASGELSAMLSLQEKQVVITSLHRVLKPFLLRRVKLDVAKDLPPKVSFILVSIFYSN